MSGLESVDVECTALILALWISYARFTLRSWQIALATATSRLCSDMVDMRVPAPVPSGDEDDRV